MNKSSDVGYRISDVGFEAVILEHRDGSQKWPCKTNPTSEISHPTSGIEAYEEK